MGYGPSFIAKLGDELTAQKEEKKQRETDYKNNIGILKAYQSAGQIPENVELSNTNYQDAMQLRAQVETANAIKIAKQKLNSGRIANKGARIQNRYNQAAVDQAEYRNSLAEENREWEVADRQRVLDQRAADEAFMAGGVDQAKQAAANLELKNLGRRYGLDTSGIKGPTSVAAGNPQMDFAQRYFERTGKVPDSAFVARYAGSAPGTFKQDPYSGASIYEKGEKVLNMPQMSPQRRDQLDVFRGKAQEIAQAQGISLGEAYDKLLNSDDFWSMISKAGGAGGAGGGSETIYPDFGP